MNKRTTQKGKRGEKPHNFVENKQHATELGKSKVKSSYLEMKTGFIVSYEMH